LRSAWLAAALTLVAGSTAVVSAQGGRHSIRGVTRDSTSGRPLAGALVQLRGRSEFRSVRSDDAGQFRFAALHPGSYRLTTLRIGYAESSTEIRLAERDTTISVSLRVVAQTLAATRVRGDISAIYGIVGGLPDLRPLEGARIQVMGATLTVVTDSSGGFFIPVGRPGAYFVRISRRGFADERFPIEIPDGRAVDASRLLDPRVGASRPALEHFFAEADERLRARGYNSAFVAGSEVRAGGTALFEGLQSSPSFTRRGLRFGNGFTR